MMNRLQSSKRFPFTHFTMVIGLYTLLLGCSSVKQLAIERDISDILKNSEVFSRHFTGFSLFDIDKNQFIANHNSTLLFTPASNTKLLTMYSTLKSFPDSIPGVVYQKTDDKLILRPIGDPTYLYENFEHQPVYELMRSAANLEIAWPEEKMDRFGSGWAWDDFAYDFQPQRSWWPIYGNSVAIKKTDSILTIQPAFFEDFVDVFNGPSNGQTVDRDVKFNLFKAYTESDTVEFEKNIPFEYSKELLAQLLQDTLNKPITYTNQIFVPADTLYSQATNLVLANMMKPSDNFLAEQLLILAAWQNGYNDTKAFIEYARNVWLADLNEMVWVDGSGLSRYNLITPVDQVRLLRKCYEEFGWDTVTPLLATGGEGTLKDLYVADEPFIYAKTGTLSNNHNLSGFLITKSGKRLIFSLMNNHYTRPTGDVKKAMEDFLIQIKDSY